MKWQETNPFFCPRWSKILKVSFIEALIAIMLFVFDKIHAIHNWAKDGIFTIYYLSEMVQTSSLIAIILFVFDNFHTILNRAKKGIHKYLLFVRNGSNIRFDCNNTFFL